MKILIAEDDEIFRALTTEILTEAGHTVLVAGNGRLAWELLQETGVDMGVFDINMPEMDGIELVKKIRADERFSKMPLLLLTVRAFAEDQISGYESGADDYLTKPFDREVLVARIKALARRISKEDTTQGS
ncbi:MAG: response regulator transcription factor [bacterium]